MPGRHDKRRRDLSLYGVLRYVIEADGIRTRNHRIDSPVLYPIELRPQAAGQLDSARYIVCARI